MYVFAISHYNNMPTKRHILHDKSARIFPVFRISCIRVRTYYLQKFCLGFCERVFPSFVIFLCFSLLFFLTDCPFPFCLCSLYLYKNFVFGFVKRFPFLFLFLFFSIFLPTGYPSSFSYFVFILLK